MTDPGYLRPPDTVNYFFTPRDEFRTETMMRTDLSFNFTRPLGGSRREIFANFHVLNVFNQFQLFDISGIVDQHDGADGSRRRGAVPAVQSLHADARAGRPLGLRRSQFGEAIAADAYTLPRTFRFSVGVRF